MKRDQTSGLKWVAPPTEIQYSKRKNGKRLSIREKYVSKFFNIFLFLECPLETLKLANQPQPSTAKPWSMANSKMSALSKSQIITDYKTRFCHHVINEKMFYLANSKANMLSSSFTHLTSLSFAQLKLLHFLKLLPNSRKSTVKLSLLQQVSHLKFYKNIYLLIKIYAKIV